MCHAIGNNCTHTCQLFCDMHIIFFFLLANGESCCNNHCIIFTVCVPMISIFKLRWSIKLCKSENAGERRLYNNHISSLVARVGWPAGIWQVCMKIKVVELITWSLDKSNIYIFIDDRTTRICDQHLKILIQTSIQNYWVFFV